MKCKQWRSILPLLYYILATYPKWNVQCMPLPSDYSDHTVGMPVAVVRDTSYIVTCISVTSFSGESVCIRDLFCRFVLVFLG